MSLTLVESSVELGHRLRTPLTHIIGYSALLLQGDGTDSATAARLATVNEQADIILERIGHWLTPGSGGDRIANLRADIAAPLTAIIRTVGALAQCAEGPALLDVLRIGRACTELLAFVQLERDAAPASHAARRSASPERSPYRMPTPASRILVVDDNPATLDMLERHLRAYGHSTVAAESGMAGLKALEDERFDLVLLDVIMPVLNGIDVLEQIKATPALAGIPVIMISALDEVESAAQCIEMGAEDYLLKPFDPVLLRARLHSALERKHLEEERLHRTKELETATEDLKRANDDLESFASVASHDLQEPLRTIAGTLELLVLECGGELTEEQRGLLTVAMDGSARMSRLISDLLEYSVSGGMEADLEHVDCEVALLEAITNLKESIRDSGAQIDHGALPLIMAHSGGLVRLLQNLVGNAIKYRSEERLEVGITAEREGADWVVSVKDNGIGIVEQHRRRIFQPFRRLHGQERPGTGLGLAICERIVRQAGGRIWVDSQPGEGSTFHFSARAAVACRPERGPC